MIRQALSGLMLILFLAAAADGFAAAADGFAAAPQGDGKGRKAPPLALPAKFQTLFGNRYLKGIDVVAEVEIAKISRMGMAVDVVTVKPLKIHADHLPARERRKQGLAFFSNRGEYTRGMRMIVFLSRFGSGRFYSPQQKISAAEDDYKSRAGLIEAYIRVELIRDPAKRVQALKALLFENLAGGTEQVRWNSLYELENLVKSSPDAFANEDAGKLEELIRKKTMQPFKERLSKIITAILEKRDDREQEQE
jgi:hypothetical protein